MENRLTWRSKIGYGVGTIGKSMSYGLASGFISYWFLSGLGLSPAFLGVMLFVARLWDGVNDLLMGAIIDSTRTKWGKFRPWMVIGAVTNAAVFYEIQQEYGSFSEYLWGWTGGRVVCEKGRTSSPLSDAISADLKKRGMKFVGTTIIYAYLQAVGVIWAHEDGCFMEVRAE